MSFKEVSDGLGKCPTSGAFLSAAAAVAACLVPAVEGCRVSTGETLVCETKPFVFWVCRCGGLAQRPANLSREGPLFGTESGGQKEAR